MNNSSEENPIYNPKIIIPEIIATFLDISKFKMNLIPE